MSLYNVEFEFDEFDLHNESFAQNIIIDDELSPEDQEASVIQTIKTLYPEATNIEITSMVEV